MADKTFDLITIGAGSGGVAASRRAAALGARVAICEEDRVGGTCVIRGCVPKKLLMYGSAFSQEFDDARGFGWEINGARHDWARLVQAKDKEVDRLEQIYQTMLTKAGVERLEGRATVVDAHTVEVKGKRYRAERILIATGSRTSTPAFEGAELAIDSNGALDLTARPDRLLVVGGGYIALEMASIFNAVGSQVDVAFRRDNILGNFDTDLQQALQEALIGRGIQLLSKTEVASIRLHQGKREVRFKSGQTASYDQVLLATGRTPNTQDMGLEAAGVKLGQRGEILVNAEHQSSVPSIYAVGDVVNEINLTPWAIGSGRALVERLYGPGKAKPNRQTVPAAIFSQPQLATVGLSEAQALEQHDTVQVFISRFRPMKNTLSGRDEKTLMKLVVDAQTDRVLGCHMVGPDAAEIIQGFAVALTCGATKAQFDATVGLHPSAAEEFVTLREMTREVKRG
ncbi:MAG: glutathione-disulfide reductase [Pigmentiphaga sp.]|nr:glutathione-disulfide reductase [Pigmentiphaga sp.]